MPGRTLLSVRGQPGSRKLHCRQMPCPLSAESSEGMPPLTMACDGLLLYCCLQSNEDLKLVALSCCKIFTRRQRQFDHLFEGSTDLEPAAVLNKTPEKSMSSSHRLADCRRAHVQPMRFQEASICGGRLLTSQEVLPGQSWIPAIQPTCITLHWARLHKLGRLI